MRKKKVKAKAQHKKFVKAIRELAKDPIFKEPSLYRQGRVMELLAGQKKPDSSVESFLQQERRQGHSSLRPVDGRLEVFDPNSGTEEPTPETDEFTRYKARTAVEWFHFCRRIEQRFRVAQREYKKGWDAFYALRASMAEKKYPTLTQVVRPT